MIYQTLIHTYEEDLGSIFAISAYFLELKALSDY